MLHPVFFSETSFLFIAEFGKSKASPVVVDEYEKECFNDMTKYVHYTSAKYEQNKFYL